MHVLTYSCPEAAPLQRWLAVVIHNDGSRAPVIFFAAEADAATHNAEAWYASELERIARQSAPRKPRGRKAEPAPVEEAEDEEII